MTPTRTVADRHTGRNDDVDQHNDQNKERESEQEPKQEKEEKEKRCGESDVMARLLGAFGGDWLSKSR